MVSVDHSSPPSPPPTNILCPYDKKRFTIEFEFSLEFENDDPPFLKPHHLSPFSLSGNKVHEKKDLLCKTCKHQAIICDYWCDKRVDENYGSYTCVNGCDYVVHSKCATRRDLWDGKELEGEPEIEYENIKTFEEIGDGIIQHFSHPNHYMRLDKDEYKVDDEKKCQACLLAIYEGNMYNCMKCDFILHKTCAHLPRRKLHQLHAHPLTLSVDHEGGTFPCHASEISGFGFSYACCEPNCYFELDVRCALVSEPFIHELHRRHPLFFTFEEGIYNECNFCGVDMPNLTCIKCDFDICFGCATFPNKVKYRYDEHFLTHFLSEEIVYIYCEICERKTDPSDGFYTCNVCSVTLHNECLLGEDRRLMKPGESIIINKVTLLIIPNDRLTRPICGKCKRHFPYRIAFITLFGMLFCSMQCIENFGEKRMLELDERWKDGKDTPSENIDLVPPRYRRA